MFRKTEFLAYINSAMSSENINALYESNNITFEKCNLYNDFIQSLIMLIFDTYMGDKITNSDNQLTHFNWCWEKNKNNFLLEGIVIDNPKLYIYFYEFIDEVFYLSKNKTPEYNNYILKIWLDIFDYGKLKTNSDIDVLIEIYKIFDKSLKVI